ncbi:MAG TPA: hypothetical protein VGR80_04530, partial [Steroidobacteraceae bacterium]|nr:hypothetical protein [Steroidobacteraceae bacterium]
IVAIIRDSQNYVRAAEHGIGVHEMKSYLARSDVEQWAPLVSWLTGEPDGTLSPRGTAAAPGQEAPGEGAPESGDAAQDAQEPPVAAQPPRAAQPPGPNADVPAPADEIIAAAVPAL